MERIIKSKLRVQKHGEVFTPKKIVTQMLDLPDVKKACEDLMNTFLEPAAGEGAFLVAILERKLQMVSNEYNENLTQYENYALLALTTLYGIELLEDNAQTCTMNMFQQFYDAYREQAHHHGEKIKDKVLDSAKEIISSNIEQGNFLTKKRTNDLALVFSEWAPINLRGNTKSIRVQRTEYTLLEIAQGVKKENGTTIRKNAQRQTQLSIFDLLEEELVSPNEEKEMIYTVVPIIDVYKVEMEEI